tara:strand:+ start:412 stop:663 length:252 start_codon:yes stop_codon:yes gene_type:complete
MRVKYNEYHKERLREEISNEWFNLPDYVQQYIEILEQETADDFNLILNTKKLLSQARTKEDIFKLRQAENGLFYRIFRNDERE